MTEHLELIPYENLVDDTTDDEGNKVKFTFDELDKRVQQKLIDKAREHQPYDDWWDFTYEDAITIGNLIGIEISSTVHKNTRGNEYSTPNIQFSGFCSQGDGCGYEGRLIISKLKNAVAQLSTHVGNMEAVEGREENPLLSIAEAAETLYGDIVASLMAQRMAGIDQDHEDYLNGIDLDDELPICISTSRSYRTFVDSDLASDEIENAMNEYVDNFASWIHHQLSEEYDYQTSDEYIKESIVNDDLLYDEDGSTL